MPRAAPSDHRRYPMPFTRLEIATFSLIDGALHVLLARRLEAPHAGEWALPGGVLRIDLDRSLEEAAMRVMRERLGVEVPFLRQLGAEGGPIRDPRAPWTLSIVYRALLPGSSVTPSAGKRITALAWRKVTDAIEDPLAFDHARLIELALRQTREDVERLDLPFEWLPETFTLGELQATCEALLGARLDKSSFRRRLADRGCVESVPGAMRGGAFRPAQLYRRRPTV